MGQRAHAEHHRGDLVPDEPIAVPARPLGGSAAALLAMQGAAGNRAVLRMLGGSAAPVTPDHAFDHASGGAGGSVPRRAEMERAFGTDFGDVRAHLGGPAAQAGLGALGASAATRGSQVVFRDSSPTRETVAHELAHVVQQRGGPAGGAGTVSDPGGSVERSADAAAAAVLRGETAGAIGPAPRAGIHRKVSTAGGEWDTTTYQAHTAGAAVGAEIHLTFTPTDPVEANAIGLTQSVKTMKNTAAGGAITTPSGASARKNALGLTAAEGDQGRAIDQGDPVGDTIPNTNPLYAVENSAGAVSVTLSDVPADPGFGAHASRVRQLDGTFVETAGFLGDRPSRTLEFAGQEWRQSFEATAIALDGPLANMYMGSVEWGWKSGADGKATLDPAVLRVVRMGPPSGAFTDAARKWNNSTFTDPATGTAYNTVDLPLSESTVELNLLSGLGKIAINLTDDPGGLPTVDLADRLVALKADIAAAPEGPDKFRKKFLKVAYDKELGRRNVKVAVKVNSTEDWVGSDHVSCKVTGTKTHTTGTKKLNDGDSHDFLVPLSAIVAEMPLGVPVTIEVFDQDWPDGDDKIVAMAWAAPYAPAHNTTSMDDADYDVQVSFEK